MAQAQAWEQATERLARPVLVLAAAVAAVLQERAVFS
jgi:hypothetical protein